MAKPQKSTLKWLLNKHRHFAPKKGSHYRVDLFLFAEFFFPELASLAESRPIMCN
jgi:hypothetical protein